ncbi:hypothetical protein I79_010730 [Cricetulus griseus]|uniref:Uncharacterized protein n=1 Tax=Cricetulus griseus TaxID=10029 RepID=G3HJ90_CRIGR|nr:hypothetical protein I79_010730 [Cricetulus griseus]
MLQYENRDDSISFHFTCCTQSQAVAAHMVVQCNHNQKVPGEGLPHWVLLLASAGADLKVTKRKRIC